MLVLAVAGGAIALFGRDDKPMSIGSPVPSGSPTKPVFGPVAPGTTPKPRVSATSTRPVATASAVASAPSSPAPTKAAVPTKAPTPVATPPVAPVAKPPAPPVAQPPPDGSQQGGTVAKKAYTFKVARGDTLWDFTKKALAATGRSTSNANVAAYVTKLYQSNQSEVGGNPDLIHPGQTIVWPTGL